MDITLVFQSIILIMILILIGTVISRTFPFSDDTKQMFVSLVTNIGMPSIILSSVFNVTFTNEILKSLGIIFLFSICINIIGLILGKIFFHLFNHSSGRKTEFIILSAFGNTGFIGIPLCAMLFGAEGALYAAIFDAGVDFTIWTVGVFLMQEKKIINRNLFKKILNLPLIAIVVGLCIALLKINVPYLFVETTNMLSAFAIPLAMFFIGANLRQLSQIRIRASFSDIALPIFIKLIILPLMVYIILLNIYFEEIIIRVMILQSMMPGLTLAPVLFSKYAKDDAYGSLTTATSTFFAVFIIPLMLYFIN